MNEDKNYKKLGFWVSVLCVLIVVAEVVLNLLKVNIEIKLIVEVVSLVLAILVSCGILKSDSKSSNVADLNEEIKKDVEKETNKLKETLGKTSNKKTSTTSNSSNKKNEE